MRALLLAVVLAGAALGFLVLPRQDWESVAHGFSWSGRAPASTPTPQGVTTINNVTYRSVDGIDLKANICLPASGGPYRALILVSGGAWDQDNRGVLAPLCSRAAADEQMVAFAINYRPSPPGGNWHAPAPVEDVRAAIDWVRANADTYRVDRDKISALGPSAGGHLVLRVATTTRGLSSAASWSGRTDFRNSPPRSNQENYVGCSWATCPDKYLEESPVLAVDGGDVPTFLAHSRSDPAVPYGNAKAMRDALARAGVPNELKTFRGSRHALALDSRAWDATMDFFRRH